MSNSKRINALSLFANVGVAEAYLKDIGIDVIIANELDSRRVAFYKHVYPDVFVVEGDICDKKIQNKIVKYAQKNDVDLIMATPPCQGMSTAGKMDNKDERNALICQAVEVIKKIHPKYVFLENVPQQLKTKIFHNHKMVLIPEYVKEELGNEYVFNNDNIIDAVDYGIPQYRERAIMLLVRKDLKKRWEFPTKTGIVTLKEAIGNLPSIDPEIYDISYKKMIEIFPDFEQKKADGLKVSKWHYPPRHIYRQIVSMMHTPTGYSAYDNIKKFQPRKKNGELVSGFKNTYKRQSWDKPGTTVTMYSREISSQGNVHPGRYIGKDKNGYDIYSDARVMTIYELMIMMSLPKDWNIPDNESDHFIRCVIGEGIPPLLVKKIMKVLMELENA